MKYLVCVCIVFLTFISDIYAAKLVIDGSSRDTVIFFTEEDQIGTRAQVKGIVQHVGVREFSTQKEREIGRVIQDRTKAAVRLTDDQGVIPGAMMYIINDRNLVVAKLSVLDVFRSASFDRMCVGYGSFRAVKKEYRVVVRIDENSKSDAYLHIARAYREIDGGNIAEAKVYFEKALLSDRENPEAHAGLGYIYMEQKLTPFALKEFDAAYKSRGRVYDREDRYLVLKGCTESRFAAAFNGELPKGNALREKYISEGIKFASETVKLHPQSEEGHYMLARFYYDKAADTLTKIDTEYDEKTVNVLKKLLTINKDHLDACIIISKIYRKHGNADKATEYITRARGIDPVNAEARELEKIIKNMK